MAALTADKGLQHQGNLELRSVVMAASQTIYKGAMVAINTSGLAKPASNTANEVFIGIAAEKVISAASGTYEVPVYITGAFLLDATSLDQADVGKTVFVSDDQTVTDANAAANTVSVGVLLKYVSASKVWVEIGQRVLTASA